MVPFGGWHWRQMIADQALYLFPNVGIAFDLSVTFGKQMVIPGVLRAGIAAGSIVKFKISDNFCVSGIGGPNFILAVDKPIGLVEIGSLRDVCGDDCVIFVAFGHAIHLNGEQDR